MMRALVTGSNGFVGCHLVAELQENGYAVFGVDLTANAETNCEIAIIDLLDSQAVREYVAKLNPDVVFHLAAQANVGLSWKKPQLTYEVNVLGTINLLEAVKELQKPCRVIITGSADQYGLTGLVKKPISETIELNPQNPYAASKKAVEEIADVYMKAYEMDIIKTRSFNHSGPGQGLGFLIPDLCNEIVNVERGLSDCLKVGNLEAVRDFSDVRDVVRAYRLLAEKGRSGEVYNVGSGVGRKAQDILDILISMSSCEVKVKQDESRMRKSDTPILVCDRTKLHKHTGWVLLRSLDETIKDTLEYYRARK